MTTPVYQVNGSITLYGVRSDWQRIVRRANSDGTVTYQDYAINTWDVPQALMTSFEALRALQGAALASLATNDPVDRNEAATYSDGVEVSLVNCAQIGRRATSIRIEVKVKIT
jgi:hypothetical protein